MANLQLSGDMIKVYKLLYNTLPNLNRFTSEEYFLDTYTMYTHVYLNDNVDFIFCYDAKSKWCGFSYKKLWSKLDGIGLWHADVGDVLSWCVNDIYSLEVKGSLWVDY